LVINVQPTDFVNGSEYEKRLPEDDADISKHIEVLYDADFIVDILCICWSK